MSDYKVPPMPKPDMDAGRSATKVGGPMSGGGQDSSHGAMGKSTHTGDGMENESGKGSGKKGSGKSGY